ncbi:hypothetical protein [Chitinophaga eiseniae]|uniref:Uncharacterized protein n=1 Tax=Chitinophaga eiseniae TaxID=634771 RepID=A0A847SIZ5_9BACT|nr:hypothetical protein [Chitinophaga eiseniae]NLR79045.1 hypothetical protein [Chitinophaga eiseniae]
MYARFTILITLLFIRVFFSPIWYSYNVQHLQHPERAFEQVRLHKRRSSATDDPALHDSIVCESSSEVQRNLAGLLRIIKRWLSLTDIVAIIPSYHYTYYLSPLFIRHCVLRI